MNCNRCGKRMKAIEPQMWECECGNKAEFTTNGLKYLLPPHEDAEHIIDEFLKHENDSVQHPSHYTDGKIETIDYIEDKKLNYHLGNAVKYISRAGKKDPQKYVEDLRKAAWYINREIERVSR